MTLFLWMMIVTPALGYSSERRAKGLKLAVAIGDKVRVKAHGLKEAKVGDVGIVHHLGVKYPGDVRVKFPHDKELLWLYPEHYERIDSGD